MRKKIIIILIVIASLLLLSGLGLFIYINFFKNGNKNSNDKQTPNSDNVMQGQCIDDYCLDYVSVEYTKGKESYYNIRTAICNNSDNDLSELNIKISLISKDKTTVIYKCLTNMVSKTHYMFEEVIPTDKKYNYNDFKIDKMNDEEVNTYCIND